VILHRRDYPLLGFLQECNKTSLEKKILDCGAGGRTPPLAIFYREGYKTFGIDISETQIKLANNFAIEHNMKFNIIKGDMRKLPYDDASFSFVFSHHTIYHMLKIDIANAMKEMTRVLRSGGLLFVNFPSVDSASYGEGEKLGEGEYQQVERNSEKVIHSYFGDNEADVFFEKLLILSKNKWKLQINRGWSDGISMIEYVVQKK